MMKNSFWLVMFLSIVLGSALALARLATPLLPRLSLAQPLAVSPGPSTSVAALQPRESMTSTVAAMSTFSGKLIAVDAKPSGLTFRVQAEAGMREFTLAHNAAVAVDWTHNAGQPLTPPQAAADVLRFAMQTESPAQVTYQASGQAVSVLITLSPGDVHRLSALPVTRAAPTPKPDFANAPVKTTTGTVTQVELLANNQVRLQVTPDAPDMWAEFVIARWEFVTVQYYWARLQTPTPVPTTGKLALAKIALNHKVTIGYHATNPPTVVLLSVHKQQGDPQ